MWLWIAIPVVIYALVIVIRFMIQPVKESFENPIALSYRFQFFDPNTQLSHTFPSIFEPAALYLSLIVPAYNEEDRIEEMLQKTLTYLQKRQKQDPHFTYELIIVSDGSRDRTAELTLQYSKKCTTKVVRLLDLQVNQGKGGAVQQGMLHARGEYLLMVDADGATEIQDFAVLEQRLKAVEKDGHGIAVGSRAHLAEKAVANRSLHRNILMYGFHFLVWFLCVKSIKDTQCGFKLFRRKSAQLVFSSQHLRRWSFDVELLYIAEKNHIPLAECQVRWEEIPGSKLNVLKASIQMGRDLLVIRACYLFGIWKQASVEQSRLLHLKQE